MFTQRTTPQRTRGSALGLEITGIGISIRETGLAGEEARFEITVPKENYRCIDPEEDRQP